MPYTQLPPAAPHPRAEVSSASATKNSLCAPAFFAMNYSVNVQEWKEYKEHVTNMLQINGEDAVAMVYDAIKDDGSLKCMPFWFMYAPSTSGSRTRPFNCELMICEPIGVELDGGTDTGKWKMKNDYLNFTAKRIWMKYPGIYAEDLPKDVDLDEPKEGRRRICLNDILVGVNKGYIWICDPDVTCDEENTDFWMPYCPTEDTVDQELDAEDN